MPVRLWRERVGVGAGERRGIRARACAARSEQSERRGCPYTRSNGWNSFRYSPCALRSVIDAM